MDSAGILPSINKLGKTIRAKGNLKVYIVHLHLENNMKKGKGSHQLRSNRLGNSILNDSASVQMRQEGKVYRQSVIRYGQEELPGFLGKKEQKESEGESQAE